VAAIGERRSALLESVLLSRPVDEPPSTVDKDMSCGEPARAQCVSRTVPCQDVSAGQGAYTATPSGAVSAGSNPAGAPTDNQRKSPRPGDIPVRLLCWLRHSPSLDAAFRQNPARCCPGTCAAVRWGGSRDLSSASSLMCRCRCGLPDVERQQAPGRGWRPSGRSRRLPGPPHTGHTPA
jgi:hypothetical protein